MNINTREKLPIFVDVQNIYYTARETFQKNFDYNAFWREATFDKKVISAFAYAINRNDEQQQQFQNILKAIGFTIKLKPFIQRQDGSAKGDWDVGITIDIMETAPSVDRIILLSGDGDFSMLIDHVKQRNTICVDVYGVRALTAASLIKSADSFREIDSGRSKLEKQARLFPSSGNYLSRCFIV